MDNVAATVITPESVFHFNTIECLSLFLNMF